MEQRAQLSLPESQLRWLSERARSCGYSSAEDYLSDLIRQDQAIHSPHEAPTGLERRRITEELARVMNSMSDHLEDATHEAVEDEIEAACSEVRRTG